MKDESGSQRVVFKNSDLRFFMSAAALRSAADIFCFLMLVRCEAASAGSFMMVTVFLSAGKD